jgi:hypothetical protein
VRLRSEQLAIGVLLTAMGLLAAVAPIQSDTWWLLRAGQEIWQTGSVPLADTYSHTAAGQYWWNHEWLTEVLFYGAWRTGGLPALTALAAACILTAWWLVWQTTGGPFERRLVIYLACVPAAAASWAVRPQVFSMLCFIVLCRWLANERRWWWIPLLVLDWIQAHGAAVLALVAIAGAGGADAVRERRLPWKLMGVWALSFVATGLTPVGFRLYPEIRASVERSAINELIEWLPPDLRGYLWPFWIVAAGVLLTLAVRARHLDARGARYLGIALATLPLAVRSTRNVHVFLMAAAPAITLAWAGPWTTPRLVKENERANFLMLAAVVLAAVVFVGMTWRRPLPHMGWTPMSAEAARAIEACPGPIYNTYGDGGILIWFARTQPVFIDNRQDPYPTDLLRLNKAMEMGGDYREAFAQYGIRCAALPPNAPLADELEKAPGWTVAYADTQWKIFRLAN